MLNFLVIHSCTDDNAVSFRYEERNDGYDGISFSFGAVAHEDADEEPETKGLPRCLAVPLRQINSRMGRPFPFLSMADISMCNVSLTYGHSH